MCAYVCYCNNDVNVFRLVEIHRKLENTRTVHNAINETAVRNAVSRELFDNEPSGASVVRKSGSDWKMTEKFALCSAGGPLRNRRQMRKAFRDLEWSKSDLDRVNEYPHYCDIAIMTTWPPRYYYSIRHLLFCQRISCSYRKCGIATFSENLRNSLLKVIIISSFPCRVHV